MSNNRKKKIKFLTLYNTFTENEKTEFRDFLNSNSNGYHRNYNKILSSLKVSDSGIIEISGTESNSTRWNRLSELHLLADKFLTLKALESNNFINKYLLLKEYEKRNLSSSFDQGYSNLIRKISNEPIVNYNYDIKNQLDKIYLNHLKSSFNPNQFANKFSELNNYRTGTFLIELLEDLIEAWNIKEAKVLNLITLDIEIFANLNLEKILLHFSENSKSGDNLFYTIKFLYLINLCFNRPENYDNYIKAKRIFFRELKSISKEKRTKYYNYMMDFILNRMNLSIPGADLELFYLINRKIKEEITDDFKNIELTANKFRDYILTALILKKYKWVSNFINDYGILLPIDIRDDHILLGKAHLSLHKKKFIECKELLTKIKKVNPFFFVDVSVLKLKVQFELKNYDECYNELNRFNQYLRKDREVQDHLRVYAKEFCYALSLLLKLKGYPTMNNLNDLQFLLSRKDLIGKKWITVKMNEIIFSEFKN